MASPSSEHEMSTVTWGTDEISLTGRSKQLICSQSKHSSSQGSAIQRAETPLSSAFFPPNMCSLEEQRKLRSQSIFHSLVWLKVTLAQCSEGHLPPPDQYFNMTYQNKNELFTLKPQDPIKGEGKVSTGSRGLQQLPTAGNSEKKWGLQRFEYRQSAKCPARESQFCQALTTHQRILWLLSLMVSAFLSKIHARERKC